MSHSRSISIPLDPGTPLPLARQIALHFRQLIQKGELKKGELLPRTADITNASQPVVMEAYRLLQSEGLVNVRRTRGTVVTAGPQHQCIGILLRHGSYAFEFDSYLQHVVSCLMQVAMHRDNVPRVYIMGPVAETAEQTLPASFMHDLARNEICGVLVQAYKENREVLDWLTGHRIPYVLVSGDQSGPLVDVDHRKFYVDVCAELLSQGCRRLRVLCPQQTVDRQDVLQTINAPPEAIPDWRVTGVESITAVAQGNRLADEWFAESGDTRPDGLVIGDDWVALGLYIRLHDCGIRPPDGVRIGVACNRDRLTDVLQGCERLCLDPGEVAQRMVDLLEMRIAAPEGGPMTFKVPYRSMDGTSGEPASGSPATVGFLKQGG